MCIRDSNYKDPDTGETREILIENTETRSQLDNRENAMRLLRSMLYDMELQRRMAEQMCIRDSMNTMVVGFNASQNTEKIDRENFLQYIAPQDLKSFGLIPEIIGRLPVLTYLEPLDRAALRCV